MRKRVWQIECDVSIMNLPTYIILSHLCAALHKLTLSKISIQLKSIFVYRFSFVFFFYLLPYGTRTVICLNIWAHAVKGSWIFYRNTIHVICWICNCSCIGKVLWKHAMEWESERKRECEVKWKRNRASQSKRANSGEKGDRAFSRGKSLYFEN